MNQTCHLSSPLPLILLCGTLCVRQTKNDPDMAILSVDDWIVFRCDKDVAANLVILRRRLDQAFLKVVADPSQGLSALTPAEIDAVETLSVVLRSAFNSMKQR